MSRGVFKKKKQKKTDFYCNLIFSFSIIYYFIFILISITINVSLVSIRDFRNGAG